MVLELMVLLIKSSIIFFLFFRMKSDGRINQILTTVVSEWEDNVLFDADDPDFRNSSTTATSSMQVLNAIMIKGKC